MNRTDVVVPAALVAGLRIPARAVTDGAADPVWVEVPLSRWRLSRQPSLRLPLDQQSAKRVRRYVRLAPWSPLPAVVALVAWSVSIFGDLSASAGRTAIAVAGLAVVISSLLRPWGVPAQMPSRGRSGDVRIPEVPVDVARQWVARNLVVLATDEPAPRPYSRRFYVGWSGGLVLAALGLAVVLAGNGREDFVLLWMLVPIMFVTGLYLASQINPGSRPS